jgi:hypothetical protein
MMRLTRREAVALTGMTAVGALLPKGAAAQEGHDHHNHHMEPSPPAADPPAATTDWITIARDTQHPARTIEPGEAVPPGESPRDYTPVITPDGTTLSYKLVDGVKAFHLIAEEVMHEFAP